MVQPFTVIYNITHLMSCGHDNVSVGEGCNEGNKAILYDILMFHILFVNGGKLHTYTNDVINAHLQIIHKGCDPDSSLKGN